MYFTSSPFAFAFHLVLNMRYEFTRPFEIYHPETVLKTVSLLEGKAVEDDQYQWYSTV